MKPSMKTHELTLGFLTLGAQVAPMVVLDAAAAAGFGAAGLRVSGRNPGDPWPSVDPASQELERLRAHAESLGVRISSISGYYISPATGPEHLLRNVEAARRAGAPLIVQGCFEPDLARVARLLAGYARAAADAGVRIAIEFMPMSTLKNMPDTLRVIGESGAANVGLLIDALHLARSGARPSDVAVLAPGRVPIAQLCDAAAQQPASLSLFDEAMQGRMYPGDGELDLAGLVRALPPGTELELETPVIADAALAPDEKARRAAARAQAFFARLG